MNPPGDPPPSHTGRVGVSGYRRSRGPGRVPSRSVGRLRSSVDAVRALAEVIVNGLGLGSIYAIVALGFVVVYKTTNVLNFAHGSLGAAGGLIFASLLSDGGLGIPALTGLNPLTRFGDTLWGWIANLLLAVLLAAALGVVVERLAIRPMMGRSQFVLIIATIGVSIALQTVVDRAPIGRNLQVPWGAGSWTPGGVIITKSTVAAIVLAAFSFAALAAFNRTRQGLAARAVASDREVAMANGVGVGRVHAMTWAIATALATVAAVAFSFAPRGSGALSTLGTPALFFRALPVIAIGGWDSYHGAYAGGLAIGLLQIAAGRYLSGHESALGAGYPTILPYLLMIAVLLVRPAGLLGQRAVRRV